MPSQSALEYCTQGGPELALIIKQIHQDCQGPLSLWPLKYLFVEWRCCPGHCHQAFSTTLNTALGTGQPIYLLCDLEPNQASQVIFFPEPHPNSSQTPVAMKQHLSLSFQSSVRRATKEQGEVE